jgi:hypothetical protein
MDVAVIRSGELDDDRLEGVLHNGSVFRSTAWHRAIADSLGYERAALVVHDRGAIAAAVPLCIGRDLLCRRVAASLPFTSGFEVPDAPVREALLTRTSLACSRARIDRLELRCTQPIEGSAAYANTDYLSFALQVSGSSDQLLLLSSADHRRRVKIASRNGHLEVRSHDDIRVFYEIYACRMKQLGSPSPPPRFFESVKNEFGDALHVISAVSQQTGEHAAAILLLESGTSMHLLWAASLKRYQGFHVNHVLYRHAIELAREKRLDKFDFGRSHRTSGTCRFKLQFGARPTQLHYYRFGPRGPLPWRTPRRRIAVGSVIWRALPDWATRAAGSFVSAAIFP